MLKYENSENMKSDCENSNRFQLTSDQTEKLSWDTR